MRLRETSFGAYRHFIDQRLQFDPDVTVLVGRNDTGKTGVLNDFMRNVWGQWVIGTDTPRLPGTSGVPQKYSLTWDLEDSDQASVAKMFNINRPVGTLTADFEQRDGDMWRYSADGSGVTPASDFRHRRFFPAPAYVHIAGPDGPRDRLLPHRFAAQIRTDLRGPDRGAYVH